MIKPSFHFFDTVDSTNDIALDMAKSGEPEGAVVVAQQQTDGRGRRGRQWLDLPGASVLMSVLLKPDIPNSELPRLAFVASLAVSEYLALECGLQNALKWPNDVMVRDKKIAGMLVELAQTPTGTAAVVGVGVNINQLYFSRDIADIATSVALETGQDFDAKAVAEGLTIAILENYDQFLELGFEDILRRWTKYMWGAGLHVDVIMEDRTLTGVIQGVNGSGALLIEDASGAVHTIHAADKIKTTGN